MLGLQVVQFLGAFVEETAELPQLRRLHGLLLPCPSLCNDSCMVQTSENCEVPQLQYFHRVVDVPAAVHRQGWSSRDPAAAGSRSQSEVPQIQFIA